MPADKPKIKKSFSRRKFLQRGAIILSGAVVATYLGRGVIRRNIAQMVEGMDLPGQFSTFKPDFWFEILADNTVLLKSPKIEMGQGVFTGFAMLAAEELNVALEQVKVEHANTSTGPVDAGATGGSSSTLNLYKPIREVAATMREMLKEAAAKQWGVKANDIKVENGVMMSGDKKMTYAECTKNTKEWTVPKTPALKPASEFKYVGKNVKRIDLKPKVMGKPHFGLDHGFPDMLYAVILKSPYIGGTVKNINTDEAAKSDGVIKIINISVQNLEPIYAVVAKNRYAAEMGLRKIEAQWNMPNKWQQTDFEKIVTVGNGNEVNIQSVGNAASFLTAPSADVYKQEYRTPMAVHAQMEPNGAVANVEKDKATIIIGTQIPDATHKGISKALGLKPENVNIEVVYSGGGFGRRNDVIQPIQAAKISQIIGKPVSVFNTREQEFLNSAFYRPNTHHVLQAKLAADGAIEAITHNQATPDMIVKALAGKAGLFMLGADFISGGHTASINYNSPNKTATLWNVDLPIPIGIWRSVGAFPNTFAIESFINELAHKAGKDPIDYRLSHLSGTELINNRYKKVLETLAEKSGWRTAKTAGIGRGVAISNDRKTIAAAVIEVMIKDNKIQVKKVTHVIDAGKCINPEGVRQQVEGCIMMGITAALYEKIEVKDGQMTASNFNDYPMAMLSDTPSDISIFILEGAEEVYGIGEPPLSPIAPAIAAAVFDLTGKNLRTLPLKLV